MRKCKKQKKTSKKRGKKKNILDRHYAENSYGVERFPFCLPLDTIPPNYYPITYGMPRMPSKCQGGVPITSLPGIPGYQAYNFVPQYGNQFGQFSHTFQQNFAQSYVPTFSASSSNMQGQTQTSVNTTRQPAAAMKMKCRQQICRQQTLQYTIIGVRYQ